MSVYRTREHATALYRGILEREAPRRGEVATSLRIGDCIARVRLAGGAGFAIEDLGDEDGHMTAWGDADNLAGSVVDITPANE